MPSLNDAIHAAIDSRFAHVHTAIPGTVESYEPATQKASIKPSVKTKFEGGSVVDMPVLSNVPVVFPGNKSGRLAFPLSRGDGVLLVFSERSLDKWLSSSGEQVEPVDGRIFDLTDAVAIAGLFPFTSTGPVEDNNDAVFVLNNTSVKLKKNGDIEIKGGNTVTIKKSGDIELGASALKKLVTNTVFALFNRHIHLCASPGSPSGPPLDPTLPPTPPGAPMVWNDANNATQKTEAQ